MSKIQVDIESFMNSVNTGTIEDALSDAGMGGLGDFRKSEVNGEESTKSSDSEDLKEQTKDITSAINESADKLSTYLDDLSIAQSKTKEETKKLDKSRWGKLLESLTDIGETMQNEFGTSKFEGGVFGGIGKMFGGVGDIAGAFGGLKEKPKDEKEDVSKLLADSKKEYKQLSDVITRMEARNETIPDHLINMKEEMESVIDSQAQQLANEAINGSAVLRELDESGSNFEFKRILDEIKADALGLVDEKDEDKKDKDKTDKDKKDKDKVNNNSSMDMKLPSGRVAKPKNIPEGIKAIYDQLTDINKVLKDGAGVGINKDDDDSSEGGQGGMGVGGTVATALASSALAGTMVAFKGAILSGMTAAGPIIAAAAVPLLIVGTTAAYAYAFNESVAPLNIGIQDVTKAIVNGTSIADENAKRAQAVFEQEAAERQMVGQTGEAYRDNVHLDEKETKQQEDFAAILKAGTDVSDMPPWAQEIMTNLEKAGMDLDTFGTDDVSFEKFGIDDVNIDELTPEQIEILYKAAKVQRDNGEGGHEFIDKKASESNDRINLIGEQQEQKRLEEKQAKMELEYSKQAPEKMDLTTSREKNNIEANAKATAKAVEDGVVAAEKAKYNDPELSKHRESDNKKIGQEVHNNFGG